MASRGKFDHAISRRKLLGIAASAALSLRATTKKVPIGLELYSVRDELSKDLPGTLDTVAKIGYEAVEFYAPYFLWTPAQAKQVRKQLNDLGLRCPSTHNGEASFTPDGLKKAVELNQILGSRYIVMAGSSPIATVAGWKALGERITRFMEILTPLGMSSGFHNHETEWPLVEGKRPMDVLAASTPKEFMLQLDVGSCVAAGEDPVAWIKANPGRIRSIHCKDWAHWPFGGYRVLFGDGACPWTRIFEAAESVGGVECYLIEQEGSHYSPIDTARRCLATYRRLRA
jgi:sugar phosphate isomerase/epimerase